MSTLKVENIKHPDSPIPSIILDSNGSMTGNFPYPNRNLLYNGAMQVAQRGTSATGSTSGGYLTADRWNTFISSLGTWTQTVENDAPTGSGFRKSVKMLCTTANASPTGTNIIMFRQLLEGQDLQRIAKGTSSAQEITLSFWVKSNLTGTFVTYLNDADNGRFVSASYAISASATWEKKTITFPIDVTGVLDNDNALSFALVFSLGSGGSYTSTSLGTSWTTSTTGLLTGQTNLAAATNNYWQVTGVQLEVGPAATPFEFKSFGQELAECQRYYQRVIATSNFGRVAIGQATSTGAVMAMMPLKTTMRATPSSIDVAALSILDGVSGAITIFVLSLDTAGSNPNVLAVSATSSGLTQFRPYQIGGSNDATGYMAASAEL